MISQRFSDAGKAVKYLKKRIIERRKQGPREKFVKGHQLIHDRKKNDMCIPILPGHDQEAWFVKLDSNRIWKKVFEFINNPSDITSAYFSCEMFRKHLEEKRLATLLPKVLGVLRDTGHLKYSVCTFFFGREENDDDRREVLKLREVSKFWKKSVEDEFLVPLKYSKSQPIWHPDSWRWCYNETVCRFENTEDLDLAMAKLQDPHSCAPLIRLLSVNGANCSENEVFYSKLDQFLDTHGGAVWGFSFYHDVYGPSHDFNYFGLCNLMSKLPNLKALKVHFHWSMDFDSARADFNDINARLTSMIEKNPFPSLPSLQLLCIDSSPAQNEFLVAEIVSKNPNLNAVHLGRWDSDFDGSNVIPGFVWDALQNLRLEYFHFSYRVPGLPFYEDFLRLEQFDWPLKFLRVSYDNNGENAVRIDVSRIFGVLSRFNDTLVELSLKTSRVYPMDDRSCVVSDFPNLKTLDLPLANLMPENIEADNEYWDNYYWYRGDLNDYDD